MLFNNKTEYVIYIIEGLDFHLEMTRKERNCEVQNMASSTQVMRDILAVAKGMLPTNQKSNQSIRNIEDFARDIVAKTRSTETEKANERKAADAVASEMNEMRRGGSCEKRRRAFVESFESMAGSAEAAHVEVPRPTVYVVGEDEVGASLVDSLVGISLGNRRAVSVPIIVDCIYDKGAAQPKLLVMEDGKYVEVASRQRDCKEESVCHQISAGGSTASQAFPGVFMKVLSDACPPMRIVEVVPPADATRLSEETAPSCLPQKPDIVVCIGDSAQDTSVTREWLKDKCRESTVVIVMNTLSDRLGQCTGKEEVASMFEASPDAFFVSLPPPGSPPAEFSTTKLEERHLNDIRQMAMMNVDQKYTERVGVWRLKRELEQRCLDVTAKRLGQVVADIQKKILDSGEKMRLLSAKQATCADERQMRMELMSAVSTVGGVITQLITGECTVSPKENGETQQEEQDAVSDGRWPGLGSEIEVIGSGMRLYGGAQYERLIKEAEGVLLATEVPVPTADEICVAMGMHTIGGMLGGGERVVSVVVKTKVSETLTPVVSVLMRRVEHVFSRLFGVAQTVTSKASREKGCLKDPAAASQLRDIYTAYLQSKLQRVSDMLQQDLESFVALVDWGMLASSAVPQMEEDEGMDATSEEERKEVVKSRVKKVMEEREKRETLLIQELRNICGCDSHAAISKICQRIFSVIRDSFWRNVRSKLNAFFVQPVIAELKEELVRHIDDLYRSCTQSGQSKEDIEKEKRALADESSRDSALLLSAQASLSMLHAVRDETPLQFDVPTRTRGLSIE